MKRFSVNWAAWIASAMRRAFLWLSSNRDFCVALAALFAAMTIAAFQIQNGISERQHQRYSVRPVVQFINDYSPIGGAAQFGLWICNHGTGLAFLDDPEILMNISESFDNARHPALIPLLKALQAEHPDFPPIHTPTSLGKVLPPGERFLLFGLDSVDYTPDRAAILRDYINRLRMHLPYSSIYGGQFEAVSP